MITAVDTSVLLDLLIYNSEHQLSSFKLIEEARVQGKLIVSEIVIAELIPVIKKNELLEFLADLQIEFVTTTIDVALLAGEIMKNYLKNGGKKERIIADFIIGAHALLKADRLLTRDRGFYREYFKKLVIFSEN